MFAKFNLDEKVTIIEQGNYYGEIGVITDKRAAGTLVATGFGNVEYYYTVKLSNGKKHAFPETSIRRSE